MLRSDVPYNVAAACSQTVTKTSQSLAKPAECITPAQPTNEQSYQLNRTLFFGIRTLSKSVDYARCLHFLPSFDDPPQSADFKRHVIPNLLWEDARFLYKNS